MNTHRVGVEVTSKADVLPPNLGFVNTIFINLHDEIKELAEDQNRMVTHLRTYLVTHDSPSIELKPHNFTPRHISQLLHQSIAEPQLCQYLGVKIAHDCVDRTGPFVIHVHVTFIKEVRVLLPSVTVPSRAASGHVFQRLVEEQRNESTDLGEEEEEEEATCSICMEDLSGNIIRMPNCLHLFHQDCIFKWLRHQNSCPLCRRVPYEGGS